MNINCDFSNPVNLGIDNEDMEFASITCAIPLYEEVSVGTSSFYIEKDINYGQGLLLWSVFFLYWILVAILIFKFVWRR